jgi:hypothetical protein
MAATEVDFVRCLDLITVGSLDTLREPQRSAVKEIRDILELPNSLGIGIADKISGKRSTGTLALTFYVIQKKDKAALSVLDLVPKALPAELSGENVIPTDVVELGQFQLQDPAKAAARHNQAVNAVVADPNQPLVVQPGTSVHPAGGDPGTFGAVVTDAGGKRFALSNCHVLAPPPNAKLGDVIVLDDLPFPLGSLANFIPLQNGQAGERYPNRTDAAIASFSRDAEPLVNARIRTLDALPEGVVDPSRGMAVIKVGRDGKLTESRVVDVHFRAVVPFGDGKNFGFLDQILCVPSFTIVGDSGALVLETSSRKAVGLNFAGALDQASVATPIRRALQALDVTLVTA